MKTSVLIIAHNEESHIRECIESILDQSQKPDEIVLIVHNSTDGTLGIASEYKEVRVIDHITEGKGPYWARLRGFDEVDHEIIACIDGDAVADRDWLSRITAPIIGNSYIVAVGGRVFFYDNWRGNIDSFFFSLIAYFPLRYFFHYFFWGANFACRKSAYEKIGGLRSIGHIQQELGLNYSAEDLLLSFALESVGKVGYVAGAGVSVYPGKFFSSEDRGSKQRADNRKVRKYFSKMRGY